MRQAFFTWVILALLGTSQANAVTFNLSLAPDATSTLFYNFDDVQNNNVGSFSGSGQVFPGPGIQGNLLSIPLGEAETLTFVTPVSYVAFYAVAADIAGDPRFSNKFFTAYGDPGEEITSLRIYSGANGIQAADNFYYIPASPSVVPLPAALPMFVAGLGLFGLVGRRRALIKAAKGP
jgi:hypothetical protein